MKILVDHGSDIHARDKDGTTPAFRAQVNGYPQLSDYFCQLGEEEELLEVLDKAIGAGINDGYTDSAEPLYAEVNKAVKQPRSDNKGPDFQAYAAPPLPPKPKEGPGLTNGGHQKVLVRQRSAPQPQPRQRPQSDFVTTSTQPVSDPRSATMPNVRNKAARRGDIRRLIRREIEAAFSDYQIPENSQGQDVLESAVDAGIGMQTLTGLMREELLRYKMEQEGSVLKADVPSATSRTPSVRESGDYEDIYNTIKNLPPPPAPPTAAAPPLPPRNEEKIAVRRKDQEDLFGTMSLGRGETSAAMEASIRKLASMLGSNWRKLAYALPIDINMSRVAARIQAIESSYPDHVDKQAATALSEWRMNMGSKADVDCLILALRKCGMHDLIEEVEQVTQEFTA